VAEAAAAGDHRSRGLGGRDRPSLVSTLLVSLVGRLLPATDSVSSTAPSPPPDGES